MSPGPILLPVLFTVTSNFCASATRRYASNVDNKRLILLAATLVALSALAGLLLLLQLPPSPALSATNTPLPSPAQPIVAEASVPPSNAPFSATVSISYTTWQTATRLEAVMSRLTGQPAPSAQDTLEQLTDEFLLLKGAGLEETLASPDEVQARLAKLEAAWGVSAAEVTAALEAAGLSRQALSERVAHLIRVDQAITVLSRRHENLDQWLARARRSVVISTPVLSPSQIAQPSASEPVPKPLLLSAPALTSTLQSSSVPTGAPARDLAPDFGLRNAEGETITLSHHRDRSNVVLVFYRGRT